MGTTSPLWKPISSISNSMQHRSCVKHLSSESECHLKVELSYTVCLYLKQTLKYLQQTVSVETRWAVTLALPARWGRRPLPGLQAQSWLQQEKLVQCHHLKCWQVTSWAEGEICREYRYIYSMNYISQNQWILTSVTRHVPHTMPTHYI